MSGLPDFAQVRNWHTGTLQDAELTSSLQCDPEIVERLLRAFAVFADSGVGEGDVPRRLPSRSRVGLAVAHALRRQAGLAIDVAADVVAQSWPICGSVLATLDFIPPDGTSSCPTKDSSLRGEECDPLVLFAANGPEEVPIAAIDEYLDVIDGRRVMWRRPRNDAYRLACDLHRLQDGATSNANRPSSSPCCPACASGQSRSPNGSEPSIIADFGKARTGFRRDPASAPWRRFRWQSAEPCRDLWDEDFYQHFARGALNEAESARP